MRLTIELSEEEVQAIVKKAILNEASKHGPTDVINHEISWTCPKTRCTPKPLVDLGLRLVATIETK